MMNTARRNFAGGLLAIATLSADAGPTRSAHAAQALLGEATPADAASTTPGNAVAGTSIGPFAEDRLKAMLFFAFQCPYSATLHQSALQWAQTLPPQVTFARIPVVVSDDDRSSAMAHSLVRVVAPDRLAEFESAAFAAVQSGSDYRLIATYTNSLRMVGITAAQFNEAKTQTLIAQRVLRIGRLSVRYRIASTPAIAVGGSAVLTPNQTNGDYPLLFSLVNGALSRVLESPG